MYRTEHANGTAKAFAFAFTKKVMLCELVHVKYCFCHGMWGFLLKLQLYHQVSRRGWGRCIFFVFIAGCNKFSPYKNLIYWLNVQRFFKSTFFFTERRVKEIHSFSWEREGEKKEPVEVMWILSTIKYVCMQQIKPSIDWNEHWGIQLLQMHFFATAWLSELKAHIHTHSFASDALLKMQKTVAHMQCHLTFTDTLTTNSAIKN